MESRFGRAQFAELGHLHHHGIISLDHYRTIATSGCVEQASREILDNRSPRFDQSPQPHAIGQHPPARSEPDVAITSPVPTEYPRCQ